VASSGSASVIHHTAINVATPPQARAASLKPPSPPSGNVKKTATANTGPATKPILAASGGASIRCCSSVVMATV